MDLRKTCSIAGVLAIALCGIASGQVAAPAAPELPFKTFKLYPKAAPNPVLRYELLPNFREKVPGNAAVSYHRAMLLLTDRAGREPAKTFQSDMKMLEVLQKPLAELPLAEIRDYLVGFRNVFREVETATLRSYCDWDLERRLDADGIGVLLPEVQKLREIAQALKLRCRLHLAEKKIEDAIHDVQIGFVMARHVAEGPTLINALVASAIFQIFVEELERILNDSASPNLYWSLSALPEPFIDLHKSLEGEVRAIDGTLPLLKELEKGPMTIERAQKAIGNWNPNLFSTNEGANHRFVNSQLMAAAYLTLQYPHAKAYLLSIGKTAPELETMPAAQVVMLAGALRFKNVRERVFVLASLPYPEAKAALGQIEEKIRKNGFESEGDIWGSNLLRALPAIEKVKLGAVRVDRGIAFLRVLEALRLHAAENRGQLPAQLADIQEVPIPKDPFTGLDFQYSLKDGIGLLVAPAPKGQPANPSNSLKYQITVAK